MTRIREWLGTAWVAAVAVLFVALSAHAQEVVEALTPEPDAVVQGLTGGLASALGLESWATVVVALGVSALLAAGLVGVLRGLWPAVLRDGPRARSWCQILAVGVGVALGLGGIAPPMPPYVAHVGAQVAGGLGAGLAAPVVRDLAVTLWRGLRKRLVREVEGGR